MPRSNASPFAELPEPLRQLAERGVVARYPKGRLLIQEGEFGDTLFIILSGRLRVFGSDAKDREITYGIYGPGEYVGEMSLDGGPRAASVVTLEASECAVIARRVLEQHLADNPAFAFELLAKVIRRARCATLSAKQMALNDVYGRLVALFDGLAVEQPDGTRALQERLTQRDIAERVGCCREMVSRLMKDLKKGGFIDAGNPPRLMRRLPARW